MTPTATRAAAILLASVSASLPAQSWGPTGERPRWLEHVAYDRVNQRVVASSGPTPDIWHHDGSRWRRPTPDGIAVSPLVAMGPMVHDPVRGEVVLVAYDPLSVTRDRTFVSQGAGWRLAASGIGLGPQFGAAGAFDPQSGRVLAFGGGDNYGNLVDWTWAWDGTTWTRLQPAARPGPRRDAAMALDRSRGRIVLFGGRDDLSVFGDTWEWDGSQWLATTPAGGPSARSTMLVYDPTLQEVLLLGGVDNNWFPSRDCWSWNGSRWLPRAALPATLTGVAYEDGSHAFVLAADAHWRATGGTFSLLASTDRPTADRSAIAYDAPRAELVAVNHDSATTTWIWDGAWTRRTTAGPSPRAASALAPLAGQLVLFGGIDGLTALGDTWTWNGATWTQQFPPSWPPARSGHALVATGSQVLLFGGTGGAPPLRDDTWSFDGTTWTQHHPATAPSPRHEHGMAFDPGRNRVVLFGGIDFTQMLTDTWEWDGATWTQTNPTIVPPTYEPQLAYDAARGRVVMPDQDRVWSYDGVDWTPGPDAPSWEFGIGAVAYDAARQRLLHFGWSGEVHVHGPTPSTADLFAAGCGHEPDLRLLDLPRVGTTCEVHVEGAANALALLAFGLQPANVIWAPGCQQALAIDAVQAALLDSRGIGGVPFAIPNVLAFRGVLVLAQAAVLDGGPVVGASLSAGLRIAVGD
jgi:hypothetical protein